MPKSFEQILGGYATDTLTEEENRQLMEAVLHDQELFDALADEEALRALLADPKARQRILDSLKISENSEWIVSSPKPGFSWFGQPSSLAWVGSIAAVGLALIFGWQMEKDWGPIVQQEEEAERSAPQFNENETNEVVFRSQESTTTETKEGSQDLQKQDKSQPERVAGLSASLPLPASSTIAKVAEDSDRMRQLSAKVDSKDIPRQEIEKEGGMKVKRPVPRLPESPISRNISEKEQRSAPGLVPPNAAEDRLQLLTRTPSSANKQEGGDALLSPDFSDLFRNTKKSAPVDTLEEELDGRGTQELLAGTASQAKKAWTDGVSNPKESQKVGHMGSLEQTKGIRYRFVRRVRGGKVEVIDISQFSGKWSKLHLVIDSNVSEHLYVLTTFGKGKWQRLRPKYPKVKVLSDGAIKMKPFRPVIFSLSQITNTLGKPVVSSIIVMLSSTPLKNLGKWLGRGTGGGSSDEPLIQQRSRRNFISDPSLEPGDPLRVTIDLIGEKDSREILDILPPNEFSR